MKDFLNITQNIHGRGWTTVARVELKQCTTEEATDAIKELAELCVGAEYIKLVDNDIAFLFYPKDGPIKIIKDYEI